MPWRKTDNVGVVHGVWGEDVAVQFLRIHGYEILERNVRPCASDQRLEIDIVAYDRLYDTAVFVEVKQHARRSLFARRLQSVDRHKKQLLRRACKCWLLKQRWRSSYRFDVIEVFGEPYSRTRAEIDHLPNVRLFERPGRFVDWKDANSQSNRQEETL